MFTGSCLYAYDFIVFDVVHIIDKRERRGQAGGIDTHKKVGTDFHNTSIL